MTKSLSLYLIVLISLGVSAWFPDFAWLAPLSLIVLFFGVLFLWRMDGRSFHELGFPKGSSWFRFLFPSIVIGFGVASTFVVFQVLIGWISIAPGEMKMAGSIPLILLTFLKPALVAAEEEIVFRGYFYQKSKEKYGWVIAIFSSAILWALSHLPQISAKGMSLVQLGFGMMTFASWGIALSLSYLFYGRVLWMPIGIHFGYNLAFSLLGLMFSVDYEAPTWLVGHPGWAPETGLIGAFGWFVIALLIWKVGNTFMRSDRSLE